MGQRSSEICRADFDVTVSAGIRQFEETGDNGFLLGVRVPFPIFDKNRDAARASGLRAESARISALATEARLKARQNSAALQLNTARERVNLLENEALPAAQAAYEASVKGYRAGRFDLTTTLNAQKDLIDAGVAVIAARRTFNNAQAELKIARLRPRRHSLVRMFSRPKRLTQTETKIAMLWFSQLTQRAPPE